MTWDDFLTKHSLVPNHLNLHAPCDGFMFETFGDEHNFVAAYEPSHVWTLVDYEDTLFIIAGYHIVNRLGYFLTWEPALLDEKDIEYIY